MNIGETHLKVVEPAVSLVEVKDSLTGEVLRAFGGSTHGGDVPQVDGLARAWNAAGTPYETLRWQTDDIPGADKRLLDALQVYLTPVIDDEDFWCIEWRARPMVERDNGRIAVRCRLVIHKRSSRPPAGILGVPEGYPSWTLPT